jgi:hypothetical protein
MSNGIDAAGSRAPSRLEQVALIVNAAGAVLVVTLALVAVALICLLLVGDVEPSDRAAVVTSAFTVLGTIIGAYTGVRIGSRGREAVERAREVEAAKVEELAARIDPKDWDDAMQAVPARLSAWGRAAGASRSGWGSTDSGW